MILAVADNGSFWSTSVGVAVFLGLCVYNYTHRR